jgi:hypothetical protein
MVSCSLLGALLFEVEPARETSGSWCWAAARELTTCMVRWMSHFGLARSLGEALAFLLQACRSSLVLTRLVKRFMVDQVDVMVFGEHCERCRLSNPAVCFVCFAF